MLLFIVVDVVDITGATGDILIGCVWFDLFCVVVVVTAVIVVVVVEFVGLAVLVEGEEVIVVVLFVTVDVVAGVEVDIEDVDEVVGDELNDPLPSELNPLSKFPKVESNEEKPKDESVELDEEPDWGEEVLVLGDYPNEENYDEDDGLAVDGLVDVDVGVEGNIVVDDDVVVDNVVGIPVAVVVGLVLNCGTHVLTPKSYILPS